MCESRDEPPALHALQAQVASLQCELAQCRQREADALRAAHTDGLTGLPNRRQLEQQADGLLRRHTSDRVQLAVLFIDLDAFKLVNDRYGHAVGDALLILVGERLREAMRSGDLACRVGGDEFVCMLPGIRRADEVTAIAHKLHALIERPCRLGQLTLSVRPSIGTALFPRDGQGLSELLAHADQTMYRHKRSLALAATPDGAPHGGSNPRRGTRPGVPRSARTYAGGVGQANG